MKFRITRANYQNKTKQILNAYPQLKQFDIEIIPNEFDSDLYITIHDMNELKKLLDTLSSPHGFIFEQDKLIGAMICIYDDYME